MPTINGKKKVIRLHRFIYEYFYDSISQDLQIDHINGNTLDNRKCNLRLVSNQQNQFNKKKGKNNTSGYKGVYWDKQRGKWKAMICFNRKNIFCGFFDDKKEAALAYNTKAAELYGEFARLNELF